MTALELIAQLRRENAALKERFAQLQHDVLAAWRDSRPRPPPPKRCKAKSKTQGRCDQPGGHDGMHSVKGEGFGVGGVS